MHNRNQVSSALAQLSARSALSRRQALIGAAALGATAAVGARCTPHRINDAADAASGGVP